MFLLPSPEGSWQERISVLPYLPMEARATDDKGNVHIFRQAGDAGEAFGAMMQWWGNIRKDLRIVKLTLEPRTAILPFYGEADLTKFFTLD